MISYYQLTANTLSEHRESYKKTLSALRPSDDISEQGLLDAFAKMQAQGTTVFVAIDPDHGIVGSLTLLVEQKMLRNGAIAGHLEDACVQKEFQRQGIGKILLQMALDHAKSAGCYKVIGDTREELLPWFERFGFDSPETMIRKYL